MRNFFVESWKEMPFGFGLMHCLDKHRLRQKKKNDLENANTPRMLRNGRQCFGIPGLWRGRLNPF